MDRSKFDFIPNNPKAFRVNATPAKFRATLYLETREEAEQLCRQFPKSHRVCASSTSTQNPDWTREHGFGNEEVPYSCNVPHLSIEVDLRPDGVKGERNETGERRIRNFARKARALGYTFELYCVNYSNVSDDEQIEAAAAVLGELPVAICSRPPVLAAA